MKKPGELVSFTVAPRRVLSYFVPEEPRGVSNSEISAYKWCRRNWWLTYIRKLVPIRDDDAVSAAGLGTLVHSGLETYYLTGDREQALKVIRDKTAADVEALTEAGETDRAAKVGKAGRLAYTMLEGYIDWVEEEGEDADLELVSVEEKHALPHPQLPGVELLTKTDARVRRKSDGTLLFIDHKTVQSITDTRALAYLQPQFRHYHLVEYLRYLADREAGRETGSRTGGVIVNMLRKVGRSGTAKPPFYDRMELGHNERLLSTHWTHVFHAILELLDTERALQEGADPQVVVPPNAGRDCKWRCPFFRVCPMFDDGSDAEAALEAQFKVGNPLERYEEGDDEHNE